MLPVLPVPGTVIKKIRQKYYVLAIIVLYYKSLHMFTFNRYSAAGLACLFLSGVSSAQEASAVVRKITFIGNRTDEHIIRRHLPFSEGATLGPAGLEEARQALFDMRHFKSVEVSSRPFDGGAEVVVSLKDGWYAIPFPFMASGSGGRRGGFFISSRNVFRKAESVSAFGMTGPSGASGALMAGWEGWAVQASYGGRDFTERRYTDGAFSSSSGFRDPPDKKDPAKYGTVVNSYREKLEEGTFSVGFPLKRERNGDGGVSARAGFRPAVVHYSRVAAISPGGHGRIGEAFAAIQFGSGGHGRSGDGLGVLLGYGLADLENRLKPLPRPQRRAGLGLALHRGDSWTGSDYRYSYAVANMNYSLAWGAHNDLSLGLGAGHGETLPFARLLATGPELGLRGLYAREQRGRTAAGASLAFSRPFRTTHRGIWQGMVFAEAAQTWNGGRPRDKEGVGFSFFYRFWRFPLPLGLSYTYSLDDRDAQVSGAIGGRF